MERRNLDFGIEMTDAQWRDLEQTADSLGRAGGFDPTDAVEEPYQSHAIRVFMNGARGPATWRDFLPSPEGSYGAASAEVAEFHFNGGRPFASIELPARLVEEPAVLRTRQEQMQGELEGWIRNRWHDLVRASGIHYERGHIPVSGTPEEEEYR